MKKHPDLSRKFNLLYSLQANPAIRNNADLARLLGVSRQAVSRWCKGTPTSHGDSIPHYQLGLLSELFDIEPLWFSYAIDDFEAKLMDKLESEISNVAITSEIEVCTSTMPITSAKVVGRDNEIELLDAAWQSPTNNVVQLIAFGGVGKSSLVNRWLSDMKKDNYRGALRIYAWSFYWQGQSSETNSSGDYFIEHALEWFGDEQPSKGTPWAKASRLAKLIRASKTLLVLDGLEPLQYSPGPRVGEIEDPAVALLIRELASENHGLCLISSRLEVADLESYRDGRVLTYELEELSAKASFELLRNLQVKGSDSDLAKAVEQYSGHPLSLSLLGGYLSVVHQGDVSKFREVKSLLDEQKLGSHAKNLMRVYLDWFKQGPELKLLFLIALYDRAISLSELKALSELRRVEGLTNSLASMSQPQWLYSIQRLADAILVTRKLSDNELFLDCHPMVRDFINNHLESEQRDIWAEGNALIFDFLQHRALATPSNMSELEPLFRAVIHGTRAGKYAEAFELYFEKVKRRQFSISTEGSHHADQACIRSFFKTEWTQPISSLPDEAQTFLMTSASTNLIYLGEIREAIGPSSLSINWFVANERWLEAASASAPLISMLIATGELGKAKSLIAEMSDVVNKTGNDLVTATAASFMAYVLHLSGQFEEARIYFEKAEELLSKSRPDSDFLLPTISSYYCKFLLDTGESEKALERSLKTFGWRVQKSWQVAVDTTSLLASDILVLGLIFLQIGDRINAKLQLDKQVELLRSADEWLYLPTGLNSRARLHIKLGEFDAAKQDLEESLNISLRTGAKFGEWEAYLDLAKLYLEKGDLDISGEYLSKAKELPNMSMYHFRDSEIEELESQLGLTGSSN